MTIKWYNLIFELVFGIKIDTINSVIDQNDTLKYLKIIIL